MALRLIPRRILLRRSFSSVEPPPLLLPEVSTTKSSLLHTLDTFAANTSHLSASGAPPVALFENFKMEPYGPGTGLDALSSFAQIVPVDSNLKITLFDPSLTTTVATLLQTSKELENTVGSFNPTVDEATGAVGIKIPKIDRARRESMVKMVKEAGEKTLGSMRNTRRGALEACKKVLKAENSGFGKDEIKKREKEIETVVKEVVGKVEESVKTKVKEILGK